MGAGNGKTLLLLGIFVLSGGVGFWVASYMGSNDIRHLRAIQSDAQGNFDRQLAGLGKQLDEAKAKASRAEASSRQAVSDFERYRDAVDQAVTDGQRFDKQVSDGLGGDIEIIDRCIAIVRGYRQSIENIRGIGQKD